MVPSPWERSSFLRGMREGNDFGKPGPGGPMDLQDLLLVLPELAVRVGSLGETHTYVRPEASCVPVRLCRGGPSVREKYSWQWEDSGEANRSTWASPNRLQISRIVSGWSRHSPGNESCRESASAARLSFPGMWTACSDLNCVGLQRRSVTRFGSVGKEDEEVRGDEPTVCLFNSVPKTIIIIIASSGWRTSGSLSLAVVGEGARARARARAGPDQPTPPGWWVPFIRSLWQSLELDTGVNHHSLALHSTAHPRTRSPLARVAFPHPPRHIPPPPVSGRGALRPAAPPPIPREEVGYSHLHPRPVDHLEFKRL